MGRASPPSSEAHASVLLERLAPLTLPLLGGVWDDRAAWSVFCEIGEAPPPPCLRFHAHGVLTRGVLGRKCCCTRALPNGRPITSQSGVTTARHDKSSLIIRANAHQHDRRACGSHPHSPILLARRGVP
jgi:hypothetical protein